MKNKNMNNIDKSCNCVNNCNSCQNSEKCKCEEKYGKCDCKSAPSDNCCNNSIENSNQNNCHCRGDIGSCESKKDCCKSCDCKTSSDDCSSKSSTEKYDCQIDNLIAENNKLKNDFLRVFADMENLKKRTTVDIKNSCDYVTSSIVKSFVTVADNLDRALNTYEKSKNDITGLIEGIKMINSEFMRVLKGFGVEKIKTLAESFNPELHQAVSTKTPEKDSDIDKIAEEIQVGYTLNGKVIKPSLVVVYKK